MSNVVPERSGWRDEEISRRHREWGYNCPAVDIDFLMVEYNRGTPVAIVEYKHIDALKSGALNFTRTNYQAIAALADGYKDGPLACFVAVYDPDDWSFRVTPLNDRARDHYSLFRGDILSEKLFVKSLYLLRKIDIEKEDKSVIEKLNDGYKR